jgi:hypothetical protein
MCVQRSVPPLEVFDRLERCKAPAYRPAVYLNDKGIFGYTDDAV